MPGATTTLVPDNVTPGCVEETKVVFTCDATTAEPLSVSFTKTFVKDVPPTNPLIDVPASFTALITGAVTGTVTTAVSQLVGFTI